MKTLVLLSLLICFKAAFAFECVGTEPFWSANLDMKRNLLSLNLNPMNEKSKATVRVVIENAQGTGGNYAFAVKAKYVTAAITSNATCEDGMSGETYTHSVLLLGNGKPLFGCCK